MNEKPTSSSKNSDEKMKKAILTALENVVDPELGIDIVNLGLVYRIDLDDLGSCRVLMTLTTIGCPLSIELQEMIKNELTNISGINDVEIELTFDPPWSVDRLSRYAKISLGLA